MLLNKLLGFFLIPKKEQLYNSVVTYFSKSLHGIRFFRKFYLRNMFVYDDNLP